MPNVEAALATSPSEAQKQQAARKPTIGQRKPNAKKPGGLGGKKGGLGAQKVKKDFAEIEREAEMAGQVKHRFEEERKINEERRAEDEAKAMANMKLAYQELTLESKKAGEKLRNVDEKKANQLERLGMGAKSAKGAISHSALNEMNSIVQEEPSGFGRYSGVRGTRDIDDFEVINNDWRSNNNYGSKNNDDEFFDGFGKRGRIQ